MNTKENLIHLEELKQLRKPMKNAYQDRNDNLSSLEKFALKVTNKVGTFRFFMIIFIWTAAWLLWNTFAPLDFRFDPFPAFVLWLFISNMIQILLLPLILISQNLQERIFEKRSMNDYEVNLKAEREIEVIVQHLEYQNEMIEKILEKLK